MANRRFEKTVTALWAQLGLPAPAFGAQDTVTLLVEGTTIVLSESRDGEGILVSASPGRLAADPFQRGAQVARLLQANLGFLLGNRAGLYLDDEDGPAPVVRVEADWRYAEASTDRLVQRVEDVLHRVEFHRPDLAGPTGARPAPVPAPAGGEDLRGEFIIRL